MAFHRIALSRATLDGVLQGDVTCLLRAGLLAAPGDVLLVGLDGQPPLARLKVTGFRRQVPFLELSRRELERAGLGDPQRRAETVAGLGSPNAAVNVVHVRLMKR